MRLMTKMVEGAAQARNEPPVARKHIEEALRRIDAGKETVQVYPSGRPSLKAVYDVAARLESSASTKK